MKDRPLSIADFADFPKACGEDPNGHSARIKSDRVRCFRNDEIKKRDYKLDGFKWIDDESSDDAHGLGVLEEIITEAVTQFTAAINELNQVLKLLEEPEKVEA